MKILVNIHKNNSSLRARKLDKLLIIIIINLFLPLFPENPHLAKGAVR